MGANDVALRSASNDALVRRVSDVQSTLQQQQRIRTVLLVAGAGMSTALLATFVLPSVSLTGALLLWALGAMAMWALLRWAHRERTVFGLPQAALWIEEQRAVAPDFALVTYIEQVTEQRIVAEGLAHAAARTFESAQVALALQNRRRTAWLAPALFVVSTLALVLMAFQSGEAARARLTDAAASLRSRLSGVPTAATPLGSWQVRVHAPAYTARAVVTLGDVQTVAALSGSTISVSGTGAAPTARMQAVATSQSSGEQPSASPSSPRVLEVGEADGRWTVRVVAEATPTTVQLLRGGRSRLLVIEGHADTIPRVTLEAPARDSVFRSATGRLPLMATVRDDIGLTAAQFELLVSSGEGERFTVRTVLLSQTAWQREAATRAATLRGTLDLSALGLQAGDVVHLRAMARDGHPSAAREFGSSETRAFRIARPTEYDSVAVEPAPPPEVDKSLLSQRMLLLLTEKLDKARPRMARADVLRESLKLARDQARLRLAVGDVVFQRLSGESSAEHAHYAGDGHEHGVDLQGGKLAMSTSATTGMLEEGNDSPVVAINQPLLEAYNAMWDAGRELEQGDPHAAIPPMKRALEAIERSRAASRLYLRGKPPQVILDLAKIRLTGKDTGQVTQRSVRAMVPSREAAWDRRVVAAAQQLGRATAEPSAVRDSLAVLRVEALADAPAFAAALGNILSVLERGGDATAAFVQARRVLGNVERLPSGTWSRGVPP